MSWMEGREVLMIFSAVLTTVLTSLLWCCWPPSTAVFLRRSGGVAEPVLPEFFLFCSVHIQDQVVVPAPAHQLLQLLLARVRPGRCRPLRGPPLLCHSQTSPCGWWHTWGRSRLSSEWTAEGPGHSPEGCPCWGWWHWRRRGGCLVSFWSVQSGEKGKTKISWPASASHTSSSERRLAVSLTSLTLKTYMPCVYCSGPQPLLRHRQV